MKEVNYKSLRSFNMFMGLLHLVQGLLMLVLGFSIEKFANFKLDIIQHYLTFDYLTQSLVLENKELFSIPFYVLVSVFLLISAIAHGLISIPKKTNDIYNKDLSIGLNRFRWYEYALSSSLMIVLISYLFGVYDIVTLLLIFFINMSMNLFGLLMEKLNPGKIKEEVDWTAFVYGTVAGLAPWLVIVLYMTGQPSDVLSETPWFVWAIVGTYFVAFNTFPVNMVLQYLQKGKFRDYIYGERGYIVLSLVAKTILAWLVLVGALQP